jgi:hypothetical protein
MSSWRRRVFAALTIAALAAAAVFTAFALGPGRGSEGAPTQTRTGASGDPEPTGTVVYLDEENVVDFTDANREPIVLDLGDLGTVTLPAGWAPGVGVGEDERGNPVAEPYVADRRKGLYIMYDSATGKIRRTTVPADTTPEDRTLVDEIAADLGDGK